MVVKSEIKLIKSLHQKKYRSQLKLFPAEGVKLNKLLLEDGWKPYLLWTLEADNLEKFRDLGTEVTEAEMRKVSTLKNPSSVLGIYHMPKPVSPDQSDWILALDAINDPGNLGTIIRLCDWFGIRHLICSEHSVDCFNPKVIQASMGSIAKVHIHYKNLPEYLASYQGPVIGGTMDGAPLSETEFPKAGILVMGNEANGISEEVGSFISKGITVESQGKPAAESLNVAMATAIILHRLRQP